MKRGRFALLLITTIPTMILRACSHSDTRAPILPLPSAPLITEVQKPSTSTPAPPIPTSQPTAISIKYGPDQIDFPADVNPLTGQRVVDPSFLKIPAMLISISHFPATARPQAGLSFAPYVFDFSITEGQTRFLAAFYGQFPAPEIPTKGDCVVRQFVFNQTETLLGRRVWLDANRNGIQDPGEEGIGGICVNLYDSKGILLQKTTTDSNGYYGFNLPAGESTILEFVKPAFLDFSKQDAGNENNDSDANPSTGRTQVIHSAGDDLTWDAGLFPNSAYQVPTPNPTKDPLPLVGPVRSGRLLYAYIQRFFQNSCLIYAFASPEVLVKLPHCSFVAHEDAGGGSMLGIDRMKAVAADNMRHTADRSFDYASNVYSDVIPSGGSPATEINVFFANLDQSGWSYDPLYQAYLRYVDWSNKNAPGILHADTDRLTGRQIHFENVIVVMADTDVVSRTNLDIHLDEGNTGKAYLFRNGKMFPITWSTRSGIYEKTTGLRRPIQFLNENGSPAALEPGHTWIIIVTPFSEVVEKSSGVYLVRYAPPEGEAQ